MFSNVWHAKPYFRICLENLTDQVSRLFSCNFGNVKLSIQNFFVQVSCIRIFKRHVSTNDSKENDTAAPHVYLTSKIAFSCNHFWCSITRTSTSSFKCFIVPVGIRQAKVNNFDVFIVIQKQILWLQVPVHYI